MKCQKSKLFLLLSVVLLSLCSVLSWAEVVLTDEEYEELDLTLTMLDEISMTQALELQTLGRELRVSRSNLGLVQIELMDSQIATNEAKSSLREVEKSWREQRRGIVVSWIFSALALSVVTFAIGGIVL